MNIQRLLLICSCALVIAGCNSQDEKPVLPKVTYVIQPTNVGPGVRDDAEIKLAEAARSVSSSLNELAELQSAMHRGVKLPRQPNPAHIGMANIASVDWVGPVEPLLQKVAQASHYRLRVLGRRPDQRRPHAIPTIVAVNKKDEKRMWLFCQKSMLLNCVTFGDNDICRNGSQFY